MKFLLYNKINRIPIQGIKYMRHRLSFSIINLLAKVPTNCATVSLSLDLKILTLSMLHSFPISYLDRHNLCRMYHAENCCPIPTIHDGTLVQAIKSLYQAVP